MLRQVIPTADRTKATVLVKVTLLEKDAELKPEMSAKVTFLAPPRAGAAAPRRRHAARSSCRRPPSSRATAAPKVFEVVDGVVKVRTVATGRTEGIDVVVTEGLSGGETLVSSRPTALKDGDRVRVR